MSKKEIEQFYPETKQHLRKWLQKNHIRQDAVWLIFYKKHTSKPTVSWSDAVDEALCFGWIDSKAETIDNDTFRLYFCKRKATSAWSKINKQKVEVLTAKGLIAQAGFDIINIAKQNGSWTILDSVEELEIPEDLAKALDQNPTIKTIFLAQSKSKIKLQLSGLVFAKTTVTRQKRILEIVNFLNAI
jgi:uncharacterized protein YdeI (YjbR/CyaY-like superfamily)